MKINNISSNSVFPSSLLTDSGLAERRQNICISLHVVIDFYATESVRFLQFGRHPSTPGMTILWCNDSDSSSNCSEQTSV